jgi:hypothetical protein
MCPSVQRGWPPPPATPFRERVRLCNVGRYLLTSFSHPLTHPEDDSSVGGNDTPRDPPVACAAPYASRPVHASRPATCAAPRVPRFTPCPASRDLRRALRPATRPRLASRDVRRALRPAASLYPPQSHHLPTPCASYIASKVRADNCKHCNMQASPITVTATSQNSTRVAGQPDCERRAETAKLQPLFYFVPPLRSFTIKLINVCAKL